MKIIKRRLCYCFFCCLICSTGKSKKLNKHLYVTDGTKDRFPGLGIYFLRTNPKAITPANIAQEVFFGVLESNGGGLLEAVEQLLSMVYIPALREQTSWGKIPDDAAGHAVKKTFLGKLDSFVAVLANARASIADSAKLSPCTHPSIAALSGPSDVMLAAANPEVVEAAETCALTWCKEIEQVGQNIICFRHPLICYPSIDADRIRADEEGG